MALEYVEALCPVLACPYKGRIELSEEVQYMSDKEQRHIISYAGRKLSEGLRRKHEKGEHDDVYKGVVKK